MVLDLCVHGQIGSALLGDLLTCDEVIALDGTLGHEVVSLGPVAQGVAKPRRLGTQGRQLQLFPNVLCMLHELARGQSNGREVVLQGRIHQEGRVFSMVSLASGSMSWVAVIEDL